MIRPALALAAALALSACAATPAALCRDGEERAIADTLYFGTNRPGGGGGSGARSPAGSSTRPPTCCSSCTRIPRAPSARSAT
jgi:hypothetical protein